MSAFYDGVDTPGTIIDIEQEIAQDYDPSKFGRTESVLIIGTAFSGPSGIPTKVYNSKMGAYYFGNAYDPKTHRTASLVPNIQAAEDAGCTTIWAMRVGGKDLYKDFRLCEEQDKYRLRIASVFPTNVAKECYVRINVASGSESITLYKPASKATIAEKKRGVANSSDDIIVNTIYLNENNNLTKNDRLSMLISTFNNNTHNNVLMMSIVDREGNDVTDAPEAQDLRIGSLFSGIYFVGRDHNAEGFDAYTSLGARAILSASDPKPYSAYEGRYYRTIVFNSDVSSDYPISAEIYGQMRDALKAVSVTAGKDYEFLATPGVASRVWIPDEADYEEADLSGFDLYQRLGDGYAITAKAISRNGLDSKGRVRKPRIVETPSDDDNHIVPIKNGTYSLLRNTEIDWRVLVAGNADDKLANKLPKAADFRVAIPEAVKLLGMNSSDALIEATPNFATNDFSLPKAYAFEFHKIDEDDAVISDFSKVYIDKVGTVVSRLEDSDVKTAITSLIGSSECTIADGTTFMFFVTGATDGTLVRMENGNLHEITAAGLAGEIYDVNDTLYFGEDDGSGKVTFRPMLGTDLGSAASTVEYILIDSGCSVYVAAIDSASLSTGITVTPLGTFEAMEDGNDTRTLIYAENCCGKTNRIIVRTCAADYIPLEEFMEILQEDDTLGKMFTFELTEPGTDIKDEYPEDIENNYADTHGGSRYFGQTLSDGTVVSPQIYTLAKDKIVDYDYTKYIPFRTTDTLRRQLAQHCAESTLRTHMTHGIIGVSPLRNLSLSSLDERVQKLTKKVENLYGKKGNGRSILNVDGSAYEIGDRVTATCFQTPVTDANSSYTMMTNGAAAYAGMISNLPVDQSTTNQAINLPGGVNYTFSESQIEALSSAGYVTTKESTTKGTVIVDGVTCGDSSKLGSRLSIVRTLNACGEAIRVAAEPFIAKKNSVHNRNALKTAIDSALDDLKDTLIDDFRFNILNIDTYTSDSKIDIYYEIWPLNEIRSINNNITVRRRAVTA